MTEINEMNFEFENECGDWVSREEPFDVWAADSHAAITLKTVYEVAETDSDAVK